MSFDWTHQFCLACDKQTDGTTYCSESCRLTDYDKTLASQSVMVLPTTRSHQTFSHSLYLPPAYDFSRSTSAPQEESLRKTSTPRVATAGSALSPSNSHTSLCSIRSTASTESARQLLSETSARELRAYARSFESVRLQRRRSY